MAQQPALVILSLVVFGGFLGGKWWLVSAFGFGLLFLDQWTAEGNLTATHAEGRSGGPWLEVHNEHRILLNALTAPALLELNSQWDSRVFLPRGYPQRSWPGS